MAISGIGSSYNQIGAATNYVQEKTTAKDVGRKMAELPVNLSISDEGKEHYCKYITNKPQRTDRAGFPGFQQIGDWGAGAVLNDR